MTDLRYPIGKFASLANPGADDRDRIIAQIAEAPAKLRAAVQGLSAAQLDTPYRPEGWTLRQVVHHVPDSHMNAYIRTKLALTEEGPAIKPYLEKAWAELPDSRLTPVEVSLRLLESLHERWMILIRAMQSSDFARPMVHPERGPMTIESLLQLYAWHGRHHTAHITAARERNVWQDSRLCA